MTYQKSYSLFKLAFILGFGVIILNAFLEIWWLFLVGIGIIFLGIKQLPFFYRCPHCKKQFDVRQGKLPHCHHCGGQLDW